ncbi:hypothetical protein MA16_Dca019510 [Dendrobium catenatum]|uniref:Uncharacterized protein n=1 Tax=Dendrobium catenatum TaxID=906689 RepID=A0A2I0XJH5_9ASPA|nr:hypothetical protein MA16_Dca019510 [Dendrobium catenatum]
MIRRMRRRVERAETLMKNSLIVSTTESSNNATTEVPEQYVNSPQLAGSIFHPLSAAAGEENDVISTEVHPQSSGRRGESPPIKKRVQFQGAGPSRPAAVVDRRGEPKKFLHRDQYHNSDHQDSQLTPIRSLGYGALARREYNSISPPSPRHSGNRPLIIYDNPPVQHPSRIDQHRHQGSESSSSFDKRRLQFPSQSSLLSNRLRVWRPKMTPTPTALMSLKKKEAEERSRKGKFVIELSPPREYTSVNPHDVGGISIEKTVDHLKENIRQINEKEAVEDEDMDQEIMEKKLEEMMTMISVMQANNPPTPQKPVKAEPQSVQSVDIKHMVEQQIKEALAKATSMSKKKEATYKYAASSDQSVHVPQQNSGASSSQPADMLPRAINLSNGFLPRKVEGVIEQLLEMSKYIAGHGPMIHISDESSLDLDTNDQEFTFSWGPLFSSSRDNQKPNQACAFGLFLSLFADFS